MSAAFHDFTGEPVIVGDHIAYGPARDRGSARTPTPGFSRCPILGDIPQAGR